MILHEDKDLIVLNKPFGLAVQGGTTRSAPHGLVWRMTTENQPSLTAPLTQRELERRLDLVYRPYHRTLAALLERKRQLGVVHGERRCGC